MKYLATILFLLVSCVANAQQHAYLIYNVTGSVQVNNGGKTTAAQKGQWLDGKEKMTLAQNAQVTLVCKSYKPIVVSRAGTYRLSSFADSCSHTESFSTAYFHYVWEEFAHEHKAMDEDRHHYMKNYGAAVRSSNCTNMPDKQLSLINYFQGDFFLAWNGKDSTSVTLHIYTTEQKLWELEPTGNSYAVQSLANMLNKPGKYYWAIKPKDGRECERHELNMIDKSSFEAFSSSLLNTVSALTSDRAEQYFMLAFLYEEQHYFANAWYYYKQAVDANRTQLRYVNTLNAFETQYGLVGR